MALLTEDIAGQIREAFSEVRGPVRLAVFFQTLVQKAAQGSGPLA